MATKRPREEESSEAIEAAASAGDKSKAPAGGVRLFVGNLDRSRVNDNVLIKVFQAHSKVLKAELVYHRAGPSRGQPRGFAFVSLATAEDAAAAIEALDGRRCPGDCGVMTCRKAELRTDLGSSLAGRSRCGTPARTAAAATSPRSSAQSHRQTAG
eukprot:TRINITY_DN4623_c0_g1_i2.p2 TRINITY_DN4623_c0_g1~~TRINITY_DN4623_c0_g1_i2.p2  ORF type:complete len:156 (+),score=13.92 TRINITY_DN4623_c0_g1_i2:29-496(+)